MQWPGKLLSYATKTKHPAGGWEAGGERVAANGRHSLSLICIRQTLKNNEKLISSRLRTHKHERINKDDAAGKQIINYSRS
jgi:hypothetical protein